MLDNWLPILHRVRRNHPDWQIIALLPSRAIMAQLNPSDTAHRIVDDLVDATVAPLIDDGWVLAPGFLAAADVARPRPLTAWMRRQMLRVTPSLVPWLRAVRTRPQRRQSVELTMLRGRSSRLLYDVHLHGNSAVDPVLEQLGRLPRFAVNHGIVIESRVPSSSPVPDADDIQSVSLYSDGEVESYEKNFGIPRDRLHVMGISRHESEWVDYVVRRSEERHELPFEDFAFVISRPGGNHNHYLPRERKIASLRALHRTSWEEHGLPLVLRTHPKEADDGTIDASLPPDGYGVSWAISQAHPFHLARHSRLGIAFFSGVTVDLVALGVPVIEFLDVRGLPRYDAGDTPRDSRGRPEFSPYRRDGLVLPADDADELRAAFHRILTDRDGVLAELRTAHRQCFADPTGSTERALALLEKSFEGLPGSRSDGGQEGAASPPRVR